MSFDEHPQPAPEGAPGLGALRREFDELVARMQIEPLES
jgi:hypothetical protein